MSLDRIQRPFSKAEGEREKKFNKPPYEVASDFFDEFSGDEINLIKAGSWGIIGQDLGPAINRLLSEAEIVKDKDYANLLETFIFDNLRFNHFAYKGVEDYEKFEGIAKIKKDKELSEIDKDIKKETLLDLFKDLQIKKLLDEGVQKEFLSELKGEPEEKVER